MAKRKFSGIIKIVIIVYCGVGILLYYLQGLFLFHPEKLDHNHQFVFDHPFEEHFIPFNKEDTISLIKFFPVDSVRKGVVLYYHGNMKNIEHYARFVNRFTSKGYEVWMEDYPGFGKSTGERTEKKLYTQAVQVQKMAAAIYPSNHIIIYGKSFGTGIAAYVASVTKCKSLLLETPYYSIPDLFNSYSYIYPAYYMSDYEIPTWKYLDSVKAPVVIFHGSDDGVIFYRNAVKLKKHLKAGDRFVTIEKGRHNNLEKFDLYRQVLDSVLTDGRL